MEKKFSIRIHGTKLYLKQSSKDIKIKKYKFKPEVLFNGKFYQVFVNGREYKVEFKENAVFLDGKEIDFSFQAAPQLLAKKNLKSKKSFDIKAAIPGKIVEIRVKKGEQVKDQQCLLVLESMKMRNEILSPINGIVDKIPISIGDQVTNRQLLIKIKPETS